MFCFKRFAIRQDGCAMKVGTDGVLLGAWCRVDPARDKAILDIGTGTGLIALQLSQRTEEANSMVEAVEMDKSACDAARRNFEASEWADRLVLHSMSVQEFALANSMAAKGLKMRREAVERPKMERETSERQKARREAAEGPKMEQETTADSENQADSTLEARKTFDHIVSNPPYFVDSLSSPDALRNLARHSYSLSYDDLMKCCFRLLRPEGRVSLVVPAGAETAKMIAAAEAYDFVVSRRTEVHSTSKSGPKRTLLEFSHRAVAPENAPESAPLVIQDGGAGTFSAEYRELTRDFYLYF